MDEHLLSWFKRTRLDADLRAWPLRFELFHLPSDLDHVGGPLPAFGRDELSVALRAVDTGLISRPMGEDYSRLEAGGCRLEAEYLS